MSRCKTDRAAYNVVQLMSLIGLAAAAFIGTVFWIVSPEAAVALVGAARHHSALTIGLVAAGGQSVALVALFFFGAELRRRWRWFDRKCERARTGRLGSEGTATSVAVGAGLLGFPPVSVTTTLLPGVAPRPLRLLPLVLALRLVRFAVLAWAAAIFGWHLPW
jgi:membrane protein YqaA with SNARE-associated domain